MRTWTGWHGSRACLHAAEQRDGRPACGGTRWWCIDLGVTSVRTSAELRHLAAIAVHEEQEVVCVSVHGNHRGRRREELRAASIGVVTYAHCRPCHGDKFMWVLAAGCKHGQGRARVSKVVIQRCDVQAAAARLAPFPRGLSKGLCGRGTCCRGDVLHQLPPHRLDAPLWHAACLFMTTFTCSA